MGWGIIFTVLPRYWGRNTRDSSGDGEQSCGTTAAMGFTYMKISRMYMQGRMYIISFVMRICEVHLARQVVCASTPFGCSWFLVRSPFAYKDMFYITSVSVEARPTIDVELPVDPPLEMVEGHTVVKDTPSIGLSLFYGSRRDYVKRNRPVPKPKTANINVYEPAQKKRRICKPSIYNV